MPTGWASGPAGLASGWVEEFGLGYIIDQPFWRMGYATEAAEGSRDYCFRKLGKRRVVALIRPENVPSLGVARKLGMTLEKRTHYADYEHLVFVSGPDQTVKG